MYEQALSNTPNGHRGGYTVGVELVRSFADKLTRLFDEVRGPGGRRWENREVVEAINAAGAAKISASYLSELLSGKKDNPNIWTVKALADFFGQSVEYFVDDSSPHTRPPRRAGDSAAESTTLADRLALLFKLAQDPSTAQVASAVGVTAEGLDATRLAHLRSGAADDLSPAELEALAAYFDVPTAVLTDPKVAEMVAANLPAMTLMGDEAVRKIAFRAHALAPGDRAIVAGLLERLAGTDRGLSADELDF